MSGACGLCEPGAYQTGSGLLKQQAHDVRIRVLCC
jgi:hypothetical protein